MQPVRKGKEVSVMVWAAFWGESMFCKVVYVGIFQL